VSRKRLWSNTRVALPALSRRHAPRRP